MLKNYINEKYTSPSDFSELYSKGNPFPHIVFDDFFKQDILDQIHDEFPDLSLLEDVVNYDSQREKKYASIGMKDLSVSAFNLISFLNSDIFLKYLKDLTGIQETLISDPYLSGGGYHEIKNGGYLKVHADFNFHPTLKLHRRLNILIYLNKDWEDSWGGGLELYENESSKLPALKIVPNFNKVVVFTTTSSTYHGHPTPLNCPDNRSRRSIALYYFSDSRPINELSDVHATKFIETRDDNFSLKFRYYNVIKSITPPLLFGFIKKVFR